MQSESPEDDTAADIDEAVADLLSEHESIPEQQRQRALKQTGHRCQLNGCLDADRGGHARVFVHRVDGDPDHCAPDDPQNLIAVCLRCHMWMSQMPTREDLPPEITAKLDDLELHADQVSILNYIYQNGPARPSELLDVVDVQRRSLYPHLYQLLSLDQRSPDVTERVLVRHKNESLYALPEQVPPDQRARGKIPLDPSERQTRILDAIVYRLDQMLPDIEEKDEVIADVVDRSDQSVREMRYRASAYQFPWEQWADEQTPSSDTARLVKAVDLIVKSTDTVSRQMLASTLIELFEQHEELDLVEAIAAWTDYGQQDRTQTCPTGHQSQTEEQAPPRDVNLAQKPERIEVDETWRVDADKLTRIDDIESENKQE